VEATLKRHPSAKFLRRDQSETPIEQTQSPLAHAVSDAIAKFEAAELGGDHLRELSRRKHYLHPEAHDYAPEEERLAIEFFANTIAAARDTMLRFKNTILPERAGIGIDRQPDGEPAALFDSVSVSVRASVPHL
jgi:hypothetical protein